MSQSVKGTIKTITPETTFGKMRKKSVILTTEEQYPQTLEVEFVNDKTSLIQGYDPGEKVEIAINIRGREWVSPKNEVKYFISLTGWKIDRLVGLTNATQNQDRVEAQANHLAF
jgi:single-strand DNA-binding protein